MNVNSYRENTPWRPGSQRLFVQVPMPADYTEEELKYAQEELVRLTYLSMYKIIDEIGLRRENESQRLREAQQKEARQGASPEAEWRNRVFDAGRAQGAPGDGNPPR